MTARLAADAIVALHLAFVVFVVLGGTLVWRNLRVAYVHLPAVAWGAYAELTATICPLTPLENALRASAGESGYAGGFVDHYLLPLLYPAGLTTDDQQWLGGLVIAINVVAYSIAVANLRRPRGSQRPAKTT